MGHTLGKTVRGEGRVHCSGGRRGEKGEIAAPHACIRTSYVVIRFTVYTYVHTWLLYVFHYTYVRTYVCTYIYILTYVLDKDLAALQKELAVKCYLCPVAARLMFHDSCVSLYSTLTYVYMYVECACRYS